MRKAIFSLLRSIELEKIKAQFRANCLNSFCRRLKLVRLRWLDIGVVFFFFGAWPTSSLISFADLLLTRLRRQEIRVGDYIHVLAEFPAI